MHRKHPRPTDLRFTAWPTRSRIILRGRWTLLRPLPRRGESKPSLAMIVWAVAGAVLHQSDRVLIGVVLPVASLTTYEVGARLAIYSRTLLQSWLWGVMPAASPPSRSVTTPPASRMRSTPAAMSQGESRNSKKPS